MNDLSDPSPRRRRVHRSAAQWGELIEAQARSGLSIAGFCRERGLSANSFYRWRRRLGDASGGGSAPRPFVRLRMSDDRLAPARHLSESGASGHDTAVVRFVDGVEVHVGGDRLGEVLALLRAGGASGGLS